MSLSSLFYFIYIYIYIIFLKNHLNNLIDQNSFKIIKKFREMSIHYIHKIIFLMNQ